MKKINLILTIAVISFLAVGCSEDYLDTARDTSQLTDEDFADNADANPELIAGQLEGIASFLILPDGALDLASQGLEIRHYDIGQKGVDIFLDILSGDMALSANSYGWYQSTANLVAPIDFTREENEIIWKYYFKGGYQANNVIMALGGNDAVLETDETKFLFGQAKAYRGYAYLYLAQIFQRSYNPSQAILPIYNGEVNLAAKQPASDVYAMVIDDLEDSIDLLEGFTRSAKHQIDQNVAKGLLAYAYAATGDYTNAKVYADELVDTSGYPLTTTEQLAYPGVGSGFNDLNTASWIWGYDLTSEIGHQLVDWWGQIDYYTYSYAFAGDRKAIDDNLYGMIPSSDIRKTQFGSDTGDTFLLPINKFFDPNRQGGGQQQILTDLLFMRIDEFYLLSAECAVNGGGGGETAAKDRLKALLASRLGGAAAADAYVDALSGSDLKDAIYLQTRIELWGEGKSYFAMKRNKATVTRGANHVYRSGESFDYDIDEMSFQIPEVEINNNPSISTQN